QGKLARSDKQATSGLGLAIAMEYSHANGGHIEALESSTGAHFRLILPEAHTRSTPYEED
ncbi:MAG TPA: cell wall metabolism sensor histidine kinase WalK, partial [Pseudomonadaceae bacterium]|nr:cell wall metabolism sensor histidine kinase WalK [Pseudomonadaceae bacterium]